VSSPADTAARPGSSGGEARKGRLQRPIFLLGAPCSGTARLRAALDAHPGIAMSSETAFLRLVKAHRFIPFWRFGKAWWERLQVSEEDVNRALRDFYGALFERHAREQGKGRWGDETPLHAWHMDEIAAVFDDAVIVAVVRHPIPSVAAIAESTGSSARGATSTWLAANRAIVYDGARLGDRFALLRHEELAAEPEPVLRELLDWLGEPWSPEVVDGAARPEKVPALADAQRGRVTGRTGRWARFFGYEPGQERPAEALSPSDAPHRFLLTGDRLADRREAFRGKLDLRRPPQPVREGVFRPPPRRYATRHVNGQPASLAARARALAGRVRR
jgi:Sulfotransferase family